jgi:hypothetical protein
MTASPDTTRAQLELELREAIRQEQSAWEFFQSATRRGGEEQKAAVEQYTLARERLLKTRERLAAFSETGRRGSS